MGIHSDNAITIYRSLYFNPNETKPQEVHARVADCISNNETEYTNFYQLLEDNVFRPNTPCMINSKRSEDLENNQFKDHDMNLAACFVLELKDDMESIMKMWGTCAKVYAGGGGVGLPLSNLREKDSSISSGGRASGPIKYLEVVQTISDTVKSGGKSRRAANLTSFKYNHPDIKEYITCKIGGKFSAVNISVLVSNNFMADVEAKNWDKSIPLVSPYKKSIVGKTTVGEIWRLLIKTAWESGDPGLLFYDEANKHNAFPSTGEVEAANPCGEVLLPDNSMCNLGSINLNKCLDYIDENKYVFNFDKLKVYVRLAQNFLDNVIDKTTYPTEKFKERMLSERPIGLGLMGLSDIFYKMKIQYGSKESIQLFENICKEMTKTAFEYGIQRCQIGQVDPIHIPGQDYNHFINRLKYFGVDDEHIELFKQYGCRNSTVTSIAPTGSISISSDCSYAFEPCFALIWSKKLVDRDETLFFVNEIFKDECKKRNIELTKDLMGKISINKGSCKGISEIPEDMQEVFVTAHDLGWKKKIEMQEVGQRWITLGISSTCNLSSNATVEDVEDAYLLAWKSKLKGITVYRDGCLTTQPINFGAQTTNSDEMTVPTQLTPMKRPMKRTGTTVEINTPHGKLYLTGNVDKKKQLFEAFMRMGQQGHVTNILLDALGKVMSKALQYGVPLKAIIDTMHQCGGFPFFFKLDDSAKKSEQAESIVDAIAKLIDFHFNENSSNTCDVVDNSLGKCPQCSQMTLVIGSGCRGGSCANPECGYSKCG